MKRTLVSIATALLGAFYRLCRLGGVRKRIVCLSRQSNDVPLDFQLLAECVKREHPGYEVVILARAVEGMPAYCLHMLTQVRYIATSEAVVLDSFCIPVGLLRGLIHAPVIQMWHSMGNLKHFGYTALGEREGRSAQEARLFHMHEGYDSVLISSLSFADDFAASMGVRKSLLYEAPLPKADVLADPQAVARERARVHAALPQTAQRENIVYCPTFRRAPASNEAEAMQALLASIDFSAYNLIFMKHPVSTQRIDDARVLQDYPAGLNMLCVADYVISDYSTVIFEAGLLDVPVYLYAYDWEEYASRRSLAIDVVREVPALFTADAARIARAIRAGEFDHGAYARFVARNIALPSGETCTQRVVRHVFDMIEGKAQRSET